MSKDNYWEIDLNGMEIRLASEDNSILEEAPPPDISLNDRETEIYNKLVSILLKRKHLRRSNVFNFQMFVKTYHMLERAKDDAKKEGVYEHFKRDFLDLKKMTSKNFQTLKIKSKDFKSVGLKPPFKV